MRSAASAVASLSLPLDASPPNESLDETTPGSTPQTYLSGTGNVAAIIRDDAASALRKLPADLFNVALTSPPYYWVRDYGVEGQIGHEESVEAYIDALLKVFDEVRRTLHPQGVFFLNIGDTYYSGNGQPHGSDPKCSSRNFIREKKRPVDCSGWSIPKKSLIGIPWRVALAMQQRGWTLRSSIIWNRCNAFCEPTARDRPHRQYEFVFMFSISRFYSFDRSSLVEEDVWLFAFKGFPPWVGGWDHLYLHLLENELRIASFQEPYLSRFCVSGDVPWPSTRSSPYGAVELAVELAPSLVKSMLKHGEQ